jgi:hypothetical protein
LHCTFAQERQVDPIVAFGVEPSAHMHVFFGAKDVGPTSTPDQIRGGATTCKTAGDTGAYWVPEYSVAAPPAGMEFVAGNSHATDRSLTSSGTVGTAATTTPPSTARGWVSVR